MATLQDLAASLYSHSNSGCDYFEEDNRLNYFSEPDTFAFGSSNHLRELGVMQSLGYASGSKVLPNSAVYWHVMPRPAATQKVLLDGQHLRLLQVLAGELTRKRDYLDGAEHTQVLTAAFGLLIVAQNWQPDSLSLELTCDPSLVLRANLGEKGTLRLSMTLGNDSDPEEDTFATWRCNNQHQWGKSGPYATVISQVLRQATSVTQTLINWNDAVAR